MLSGDGPTISKNIVTTCGNWMAVNIEGKDLNENCKLQVLVVAKLMMDQEQWRASRVNLEFTKI